jgi:hypothetical protein
MKTFHCSVLLFCLGIACLRAEEAPSTPIIVKLDKESPLRPTIGDKQMTLPEIKRFFADVSDRFGRKDPIIIQLDKNEGIHIAILLAKIAHQTHDAVFIEVSGSESEGIKYIVEIPKNGIKTINDEQKGGARSISIPDIHPNSQRDQQIRRLQNLQQGIIE